MSLGVPGAKVASVSDQRTPTNGIFRREFVAGAGAATGALVVTGDAFGLLAGQKPGPGAIKKAPPAKPGAPSASFTIQRREDFLHLEFDLYNLKRVKDKYVRINKAKSAYVVVTFVPQALLEEGRNLEKPGQKPYKWGTLKARLSGSSRLAFAVPAGVSIPATVDGLLDWTKLVPSLAPAAQQVNPKKTVTEPKLSPPGPKQTSIELPLRLALSPTPAGRWRHPRKPVTRDGWTEVWETRLTTPLPTGGLALPNAPTYLEGGNIRAVWAFDKKSRSKYYVEKGGKAPDATLAKPFAAALNPLARYLIVRATTNTRYKQRADVKASALKLSTMGGTLKAHGRWAPQFGILEWQHVATMGRDHFSKVVLEGYIFPWGHKAVLTQIAERKFEVLEGRTIATVRLYQFVSIIEQAKSYRQAGSGGAVGAHDSRDMPFRTVEVLTEHSPRMDNPMPRIVENPKDDGGAFVIGRNTSDPKLKTPTPGAVDPFGWRMVGTDWAGRRIEFTAPAVFVPKGAAENPTQAANVLANYANVKNAEQRTGRAHGQTVAMADAGAKKGSTDVVLQSFTFGGRPTEPTFDNALAKVADTLPRFLDAAVRLPGVEGLIGKATQPTVKFVEQFVAVGFDGFKNKGEALLEIIGDNIPKIEFPSGNGGGVMTPDFAAKAFSRSRGVVGDAIEKLAMGQFDPADFFKDLSAKILGGVDLLDLLYMVDDFTQGSDANKVFRITTAQDETTITTTATFTPPLLDNEVLKIPDGNATLRSVVTTDILKPQDSQIDVVGEIKDFDVVLLGSAKPFITLKFRRLAFESKNGAKADPDVDLETVEFGGALKFVEKLSELMSFAGDEGGPKIDIQPSGLTATMSVPLPSIGVGIFSISNIAIGAGFNLPFTGDPARFRFDFSTREDPFALSVAIFGGGGFFGIAIGADGVELIEAALEFGASCSFDIGVASGGVHILAGIYFKYGELTEQPGQYGCELTGYVRLGGELSILGIIKLSLEFYMGLTYVSSPGKVIGEAILTVEVTVLFFTIPVELKVRKEFGKGAGNGKKSLKNGGVDNTPTFADQMDQAAWDEYCDAFAS